MPSPVELPTFATDDDALHAAENNELLPWHLYALEEGGMVIIATGTGTFHYCAAWNETAQFGRLYAIDDFSGGGDVGLQGAITVASTKVIGARGAAVANPTGGSVVDVQARAQLAALLDRLRATGGHGLIA